MTTLKSRQSKYRIAYFITPHGFGHAARAAAVMASLREILPSVQFDIFTEVPKWFFEDSIPKGSYSYHPLLTDVGMAQETPLKEDLSGTIGRLDEFFPLERELIGELAQLVRKRECRIVLCDIAPMGIAVAEEACIPSVLIENFTWDWIYESYANRDERIAKYAKYLGELFDRADYRIQTEPVCRPVSSDLTTEPVSRKPKTSPERIRKELDLPDGVKSVLITMGGMSDHVDFSSKLDSPELDTETKTYFIIPGASEVIKISENMVRLPHRSGFFHPDLVNASDAVVGKAGYSTLAEVYNSGVPFGYIARATFPESETLTSFVQRQMEGISISEDEYRNGDWTRKLPELLKLPRMERRNPNGSDQIAGFLLNLINV